MTKWVCFDGPGAAAVESASTEAALRDGNPLMAALRGPGNSVLLIRTSETQELALVSVIKREITKRAAPVVEFARPISRTATGFLGLTDEPEFADEPQKKSWWKRLGS